MKLKIFTLVWVMVCITFFAQLLQIFSQETINSPANFTEVVEDKLKKTYGIGLNKICPVETDSTAKRIFSEYGAVFISSGTKLPGRCIFSTDIEIQSFQMNSLPESANVGGVQITLQKPAMDALQKAVQEASKKKLRISPRGGSLAAGRSFEDTIRLWNSRFYPGLNYWIKRRKISQQEAGAARALPIREQVTQVLEWEKKGLFFSKDLTKSILFSVAAPGASQHNFLLALDVEQFSNKEVRKILAENFWYQTVLSDLPHFTYLGVKETDLPALGLKRVSLGNQVFWIPNIVVPTMKLEVKDK